MHDHGHGGEAGHGHGQRSKRLERIRALVGGHHHGTEEMVDGALASSARGIFALKVSLLGLGATALFQLVIAMASGSAALFADTAHNFSDALTAVPLWVAFALARRPATKRFTYGYGRAEDLAGIFIVALVALSAGIAAWGSIQRLVRPEPVEHLGWVVAAAVVGFLGNEAVAMYRIRVGSEIGSAALVADGYHARADGLTSLAVLGGALGVIAGYPLADPLVGLGISIAILFVLRDAARQIYRRLMDAVDPELTTTAERVLGSTPRVEGDPLVRIRWVGHQLWAEAQVTVDCELSLLEAHAIAEEAQHRLLHELPRLARVTVHVDPCTHQGRDHHVETAHHFAERGRAPAAPRS